MLKKIMENLENNVNNKEKMPKLLKRITTINKMKHLSNVIKERNNKKDEEKKVQEDNIKSLYDNNNKEANLPEEKLDGIANTFINDIFVDTGKTKESEQVNNLIKDEKIKNASNILNTLTDEDKKIILDKLRSYVKEKDQDKDKQKNNQLYINKLVKLANNLDKMKSNARRIKKKVEDEKAKKEPENINADNEKNIDENKIVDDIINNLLNNEKTKDNQDNIDVMANTILNYNKDNQDKIINKLKEEAKKPERKAPINKLLKRIEFMNKMKNFAKKVKDRKVEKKAEQEIHNEENFGIIMPKQIEGVDKNNKKDNIDNIQCNEIIIKKPEELKEEDLNKLTNYFISDIYTDVGDKKDDENAKEINSFEKYKKIKMMEKK